MERSTDLHSTITRAVNYIAEEMEREQRWTITVMRGNTRITITRELHARQRFDVSGVEISGE